MNFLRYYVIIAHATLNVSTYNMSVCECAFKQRFGLQCKRIMADRRRNRAHHCCTGLGCVRSATRARFAHQWATGFLSCRHRNETGREQGWGGGGRREGEKVLVRIRLCGHTAMPDTHFDVMLCESMNAEANWYPNLLIPNKAYLWLFGTPTFHISLKSLCKQS